MSNESDDHVSCVGSFVHSLFLCEASHFFFFCLTPLLPSSSCCVQAQWYHQGIEPLGRPWQRGDVVGCLVDMAERTMMVTLNGEVLFNDRGSELAAKDFDIKDGLNAFKYIVLILSTKLNNITRIIYHYIGF